MSEPLASAPGADDPLRWLRLVSLSEGVSWIVLLLAMGLKYGWGWPWGVRVVGMIHGVLFLLLMWLLVRARMDHGWPARRVGLVFAAAMVPGWPFVLDRRLREWTATRRPAA